MSYLNNISPFEWGRLPSLPDAEGFASPFAGTSGGLIVAGGANFPDKRPWDGGAKEWSDLIFVLPDPKASWRLVGKLPVSNAYGISISTPEGLICIGGGNAQHHFREVFRLAWDGQRLTRKSLPPLPQSCAFASGTLVNDTIYVVGGIDTPNATRCLDTLWALDLSNPQKAWEELPPCPGGERMLAVMGATRESLFLFSGARLSPGPATKPLRECLRDAWSFTPGKMWKRLADVPRAAVAAVSPAPCENGDTFLVIGGDDGTKVHFTPPTEHPGFPRDVIAYDITFDRWTVVGHVPFSRATVPLTVWHDQYVIVNGEVRPGYRTPEIKTLSIRIGQRGSPAGERYDLIRS